VYSSVRETNTADSSGSAAIANSGSSTKPDTGAIIGGVFGGLALLYVFGIAVVYLLRRDKSRKNQPFVQATMEGDSGPRGQSDSKGRNLGGWGPRELPVEPLHSRYEPPASPRVLE